MNTNSDRHFAQLFIEQKLGCSSAADFAEAKEALADYTLGYQDAEELRNALDLDADALFAKGLACLLQGLAALDRRAETWAFIQLYYSCFFFEKRKLARDGLAVLNCKGTMYSLIAERGEQPSRHSGKTYSNDHRAAASLFISRYKDSNVLLSQLIDGEEALRWLFNRRSWLNEESSLTAREIGL